MANNIPKSVLSFAANHTDVYTAFRDYVRHYNAQNGSAKADYDKTLNFSDKEAQMNKSLREEILRVSAVGGLADQFDSAVFCNHPNVKWATFAVIGAMIDMIIPETILDSIGLYTDVRNGDFGDSFAFDVKPRDLFAVTKMSRGKRTTEVKKQFNGQVTVVPVEHDITVGVSLYRVLSGKESLAEFAMKAVRSIETQMTIDAYTAFNAAMTNLPTTPSGGPLKVAGYSQDTAIKLAQTVTAYNMGAKAVFVGTPVALNKLVPTNNTNYRYMLDSDIVKLGYVRTAFGYDTMAVNQVADWGTPFQLVLDDARLYVISPSSEKLVKLCIEGATQSITTDTYARADLTQVTTLKKNWGAAVVTSAVSGLITL